MLRRLHLPLRLNQPHLRMRPRVPASRGRHVPQATFAMDLPDAVMVQVARIGRHGMAEIDAGNLSPGQIATANVAVAVQMDPGVKAPIAQTAEIGPTDPIDPIVRIAQTATAGPRAKDAAGIAHRNRQRNPRHTSA